MKLLFEHFFTALLIGCIGWFVSDIFYCVPCALIAGWLIDLDHICDFLLYSIRSKRINLSFIRTGEYFKLNNTVIVPLHAWEITALLLILGALIPGYRALLLTAAIAHGAHLLQDQYSYRVRILGYSLISRAKNKFSYQGFCRSENG
jgi:hypothetical protein